MEAITGAYLGLRTSKGQTMAEYGLIVLALVAVVTVAAWTLLGDDIKSIVNSIAGSV